MRYCFFLVLFFWCVFTFTILPQESINRKYHPEHPLLIKPTNHDPYFKNFPAKSFYESRNNWQAIIDSTWGPGLPLANKLLIFNDYTSHLQDEFDGFLSLGMDWYDWNSLRNHYLSQINDSTSRGGFSAIMSQLANSLRDAHTRAVDTGVTWTPLNPGIPLLMLSSYTTIEHFGAVLTALPDSTLLVLRTVPNHPLDLQPGDIILGYQGVPWKIEVQELLAAGLPFVPNGIGAASAYSDFLLLGAGMNWHLFDTMDIVQYSSSDTLHLPVAPMINLNLPHMLNNEQVEIPGIPFPTYFDDQLVTYGILNNINIGYIYLFAEWPEETADQQFAQAVTALQNTEGLIIDMRLNFGGWALFDEAFDILFGEFSYTINDAYRSSSSSLALSPVPNAGYYQIDGLTPTSLYEHPIAILLGPTCISMGDLTAQRFRYHPMVAFFGKPPGASLGDNLDITGFTDWVLRYSIGDMFHVNSPDQYLNRTEFPIDFPIWHNPAAAANGRDAVVERALEWITNLSYAHNVSVSNSYFTYGDSVHISTIVENPNQHELKVSISLDNFDFMTIDSSVLFNDGLHGDGEAGDSLWAAYYTPTISEESFLVSVTTEDSAAGTIRTLPHVSLFTTIGPVVYDGYHDFGISPSPPYPYFGFKLVLKNIGLVSPARSVTAEIVLNDTFLVKVIENNNQEFGDINPGETGESPNWYFFYVDSIPRNLDFDFKLNIYSNGYLFWQKDTSVIVGIEVNESALPQSYELYQNYPNPFNPVTAIKFDLPRTSQVTLKIYNILGEEVATLVSAFLPSGAYKYDWNASGIASGVYLYRLQAGDGFIQTKKLMLIR
jgi:hypothetical protein